MFWKRKKHSPAETATTPVRPPTDLLTALQDPDSWESLPARQLGAVAFVRLTAYGRSCDASEMPQIQRLYSLLLRRLDVAERLRLEQTICQFIEEGKTTTLALLPFVLGDTDRGVVSTATIDVAMLMRRTDGDPLTGPKFFAQQLDDDESPAFRTVGVLSGLILLGDGRLLPLVLGRWRHFKSAEERRQLAAASSGTVSTLLIEFLLDWLEDTTDESDIGAITGALCRMPSIARGGCVVQERRCFPIFDAGDQPPVRVVGTWSFGEYAELIRPRLEPLMARESEPKIIHKILEAWTA